LTTISRQILCKQAGRKNYVPSAPLIKEKSQGLIPDFVYSLRSWHFANSFFDKDCAETHE